jgi:tellurite resistance protein TerC
MTLIPLEADMHVPLWVWLVVVGTLLTLLIFDAVIIGRKPHVPSTAECARAIAFYVALALLFGAGMWFFTHDAHGAKYATEFYAGWLTEYSLSMDNLFIFLIIMEKQRVPRELQQFTLMVGIMLALVFRGIFIALGATIIEQFAWVFFIFGAWLLWTAFGVARDFVSGHEDDSAGEGKVFQWIKSHVPTTNDWRGDKLFVRVDGKLKATLVFFVIVSLGSTDVMFALDSIPAIFGLTTQAFIVFTANVFALMGLRQLYFLLGNLMEKLYYLPVGLTVLLTFIGVKLVLHAMHQYHLADWFPGGGEIPTPVSLGAIVLILGVTAIASILRSKLRKDSAPAEATEPAA